MRLGIDLDGVVADFNGGWMLAYNEQFGAELTPAQVISWDGLHTLTHFPDMGEFWRWAKDHGGKSVFRHLLAYEGAVDTLRALNRKGHDIVVITAKPDWAVHDTFEWLADNRVPTREVHVTDDKWMIDCDLYLDVSPYQVVDLVEKRPDRVICRFVRPWNRPVEGARDVHDWDEFSDIVGQLQA
jgi:5'(3')-deoxyribonucleotidase